MDKQTADGSNDNGDGADPSEQHNDVNLHDQTIDLDRGDENSLLMGPNNYGLDVRQEFKDDKIDDEESSENAMSRSKRTGSMYSTGQKL